MAGVCCGTWLTKSEATALMEYAPKKSSKAAMCERSPSWVSCLLVRVIAKLIRASDPNAANKLMRADQWTAGRIHHRPCHPRSGAARAGLVQI